MFELRKNTDNVGNITIINASFMRLNDSIPLQLSKKPITTIHAKSFLKLIQLRPMSAWASGEGKDKTRN